MAAVKEISNWGFVDTTGKIIIDAAYEEHDRSPKD